MAAAGEGNVRVVNSRAYTTRMIAITITRAITNTIAIAIAIAITVGRSPVSGVYRQARVLR